MQSPNLCAHGEISPHLACARGVCGQPPSLTNTPHLVGKVGRTGSRRGIGKHAPERNVGGTPKKTFGLNKPPRALTRPCVVRIIKIPMIYEFPSSTHQLLISPRVSNWLPTRHYASSSKRFRDNHPNQVKARCVRRLQKGKLVVWGLVELRVYRSLEIYSLFGAAVVFSLSPVRAMGMPLLIVLAQQRTTIGLLTPGCVHRWTTFIMWYLPPAGRTKLPTSPHRV